MGEGKADKASMALNEIRKLYGKFYKSRDEEIALEGAMKTLPKKTLRLAKEFSIHHPSHMMCTVCQWLPITLTSNIVWCCGL